MSDSEENSQGGLKTCPKCGWSTENAHHSFCMSDGTRLVPVEPDVLPISETATCSFCDASLAPGHEYCGSCGINVSDFEADFNRGQAVAHSRQEAGQARRDQRAEIVSKRRRTKDADPGYLANALGGSAVLAVLAGLGVRYLNSPEMTLRKMFNSDASIIFGGLELICWLLIALAVVNGLVSYARYLRPGD